MKKVFVLRMVIILFLFLFTTANATVLYVHPDSSLNSIQSSLDSCLNYDTVLVGMGTYYENLIWPNTQGISLLSEYGPDLTLIDGENAGSVIMITTGVDSTTIIRGFTIQNGFNRNELFGGGGIRCVNSSPTIIRNIIARNRAHGGGGITCYLNSSPKIINNIITENISDDSAGGVKCTWNSSPNIFFNIITKNTASENIGAGGGISCTALSSPIIYGNIITMNSSSFGGGIEIGEYGTPIIINNNISWNRANNYGGGIQIYSNLTEAIITNNIITKNSAGCGGGIADYGSDITITFNNIWGNTRENYCGCSPGIGCISADPLFKDASVADYRLLIGSPCIDAGDNNAFGLPEFDFDGNLRILDGNSDGVAIIDIGAFEYLP